ncbi:MAG TPA: MerR family transcriptional regulator [Streptosporangiaceae bacterium]|jgi:DNA-binding transcriptional MerR regulator
MSAQPARAYLGISEVLAQLRTDFPDVSVSKIRFLETEGLLTPARSPSGYRRFSGADVDRLRYILAAQRDHYLPLRVIRERLARLEAAARASPATASHQRSGGQPPAAGPATAGPATANPEIGYTVSASTVSANTVSAKPVSSSTVSASTVSANTASANTGQLLSRRELVELAGLSEALLTELEAFGLLRRVGRHYGPDALVVARTAVTLTAYGVEARHLRAVRASAERETTMIESLVAPIQRQRGAGARDLAARTAGELADLVMRLHGALVDGALAEAGLADAALTGGGLAEMGLGSGADGQLPERDGRQVRGAGGASA